MISASVYGMIGIIIGIVIVILTAVLWRWLDVCSDRNLFGVGFIATLVTELIIIIIYFIYSL